MRTCGILMHISSLPSPYGIGNFGACAREFVDFLKNARQHYWQILPLNVTSYGDSPYQSPSTFAGNPYFIDPDELVREGLLTKEELDSYDFGDGAVDYERLYNNRYRLLRAAFSRFVPTEDYLAFCKRETGWLFDYSLFMALKNEHGGAPWSEWEKPYRSRRRAALRSFQKKHRDDIEFERFMQYLFARQWEALKKYANKKGIKIIGDLPIYVAYDSADVWTNPSLFDLQKNGLPRRVAACPPDGFSATGQLWGNPVYDWEKHRRTGYDWWARRIKHAATLCDIVRIDHFRGFESFYSVPFGSPDAVDGYWTKGPDIELFEALEAKLGRPPIIAENLGFLTDEARLMHKKSGFPGMKVLEFGFYADDPNSENLPPNIDKNTVLYIGTHDNPPVEEWRQGLSDADKAYLKKKIGIKKGESYPYKLVEFAFSTVADTVIIQMQDYLCLGRGARMNEPSTLGNNWVWRAERGYLTKKLAERIAAIAVKYSRASK